MNDRHYYILTVQVEVADAEGLAESLAPILKITDEMAMPYDAQRVGLAEFHFLLCGMC
jgi:hypothetical protein